MLFSSPPVFIHSRDNALVKDLHRLAHDNNAYRKQGRVWLEGDHLCHAFTQRGLRPLMAVFSESFWHINQHLNHTEQALAAPKIIVIADALWSDISGLECPSPQGMGFVIPVSAPPVLQPHTATVVLDRLQDAGNVGAILRSAAAFGFTQIAALKGTAALWSPKVVRAGMGAHFALQLLEGLAIQDLTSLCIPLLATHVHEGTYLHRATLPWPCAWVLGHEGQGVTPALHALASQRIRIIQPGGEESLNVAAAAAICLHASAASMPA